MNNLLTIILILFIASCSESKSENVKPDIDKKKTIIQNEDSLIKVVDSMIDERLDYFIKQFGSAERMEEFYGKSIPSIKEEYRKIFLDSLRKIKKE